MTDPIIAEINRTIIVQGPRGGELEVETGILEVHLSDAPKVELLLETLKKVREYNKDAPETEYEGRVENGCCFNDDCEPENGSCPRVEMLGRIDMVIRAIEPEWSP